MKYKVGQVFKHKNSYILVTEGRECLKCFFDYVNYPYIEEEKKNKMCYRKNLTCSSRSRLDKTDVYYKEITGIEYLFLKGSDKNEV